MTAYYLKRITELEDFSTCWPKDEWVAKAYVAEIKRIVDIKDLFTRIRDVKCPEIPERPLLYQLKITFSGIMPLIWRRY